MIKSKKGFTLVELMIVMSIIAILAAIAYPSYIDFVRKSRRADAQSALVNVQLAQQKLRSSCRFYASAMGEADSCGASAADSTVNVPPTSPDGWYNLTLSNVSATGFTVTATGQRDQANDDERGVVCTMVLSVSAANPNGLRTPAECWD